tara:strand:- start:37 stop:1065 length:1029 start_codon:yes stop_codon:yes gene_type:complete
MSQNSYNAKIFVGKRELSSWKSITFKDAGNNKVTKLTVSTTDPELDNMAIHGKELIFYLNYGALDTVPFFRGRIKESTPTNKSFNFTAYDMRTFLTGKDSLPINITDSDNYDGYTLGQFLYEYIDTVVNYEETLIGLDMINDSNPTVSLSGFRADNTSPLKVIQQNIKPNRNSATDIKNTRLIMRDDGQKSNICFVEEQSKNDSGIEFGYNDGIASISFKRRPTPNIFNIKSEKSNIVYKHNNLPTGVISHNISDTFEFPDEGVQEAFHLAEQMKDAFELSITVNKGHYLDIGNIIVLDTPDFEYLSGKHRIVSKSLNVSDTKVSCTFGLSKEGPTLSNYSL